MPLGTKVVQTGTDKGQPVYGTESDWYKKKRKKRRRKAKAGKKARRKTAAARNPLLMVGA